MAANMDGVGTFEMATELATHELFTCIAKQHSEKDWESNIDNLTND